MSVVASVSRSVTHQISKARVDEIRLVAGEGVDGDAHRGVTMRHRSRDPRLPNLRQVHLVQVELLEALDVPPGAIGENVTTRGVDLLALPVGARLRLGDTAVVEVTGLRNPCAQLDGVRPGLMAAVLDRDSDGNLIRKAGVMAIVVSGGMVRPGDAIVVELPPRPHARLAPV